MVLLIITIPLFSSLAIFSFGRYLGQKGAVYLSIISILSSMILGWNLLIKYLQGNDEIFVRVYDWINNGMIDISINLLLDKYSIFMVMLITTITFVVITYSSWYMSEDPHKNRFLAILLMFAVTMLILVTTSNFFVMFVGWEGVGIMSYLLINFWYNSINSNKSAIKAVLYNKIGDIGFLLGISLLFLISSNTNIQNMVYLGEGINNNEILLFLIIFFLFAAVAKSAQIFLHPWLGDAMAGPTPVSALLHAATMVTAGVFLLFRLESLLYISPLMRNVIIIIGILTIIFGGISSINQNDIKKIIAYSTCSQLGYMFLTNGLLLPSLGLFHLLTHGFFKALLFLTAGIIIHNFHHEQDIRKFGSLIFSYPISFFFFLLGSLSILSFPFLSGFYSKEAIIESSLAPQYPIYIYILMVIGGMLTSIYSVKLIYYTFLTKSNSSNYTLFYHKNKSIQEIPSYLLLVLTILVLGSMFIGYFFKEIFLTVLLTTDNEFFPFYIKLIPLLFSLCGILLAFVILNPWRFRYILTIFNKRFFFDSLINYFFALTSINLGYKYLFKFIDRGFLEYFGPIGLLRLIYSIPLYYSTYGNNPQHDHIYKSDINSNSNLFIYLFITFSSIFFLLFYF